jgi:type IV secretion system protein VirB10
MSNELSCGSDPQTGQTYRFNPQTGQPCDGLPQERVVVRQAPAVTARSVQRAPLQDSPELQQRLAAYQEEAAAMVAPMAIGNAVMESPPRSPAAEVMPPAALGQTLSQAREGADALPQGHETEYDAQNAQTQKEAFLNAARGGQSEDYLPSIRLLPLSRYEIKAGWEIPAILEQSLNSDLPGELKALVSSNVYDTATGLYLLIPQGSRLIGRYDSRVSYGQDGLQVAWSRVIYPDASSIDLNGMAGLDSHGAAGLRDTVDHHYKRLIGGVALSTLFTAGFAISQARNQSVLSYQTPGQAASTAVGQEVNETGAQLARRNLNVQPTIKVPAGYRFTVRVNRDILFDAPYEPMPSNSMPLQPGDNQLHRRATER